MKIQEIIDEVEREEKEIEHDKDKVLSIDFMVENELTIGQIRKFEQEIRVDNQLRLADKNLTKCLSVL